MGRESMDATPPSGRHKGFQRTKRLEAMVEQVHMGLCRSALGNAHMASPKLPGTCVAWPGLQPGAPVL